MSFLLHIRSDQFNGISAILFSNQILFFVARFRSPIEQHFWNITVISIESPTDWHHLRHHPPVRILLTAQNQTTTDRNRATNWLTTDQSEERLSTAADEEHEHWSSTQGFSYNWVVVAVAELLAQCAPLQLCAFASTERNEAAVLLVFPSVNTHHPALCE